MKRSIILILQILTMLIMVSNHFLHELLEWFPIVYFFGIQTSSLIVDVTLYIPIILQGIIIYSLAEEEVKE